MREPFTITSYGQTDRGQKREKNEDQFLVADLHKSMHVLHSSIPLSRRRWLRGDSQAQLLLVADGMGGMGGGEIASRTVVNTFVRYAVQTMDWIHPEDASADADIAEDLIDALKSCKSRLERFAKRDPAAEGMGTTLTLAYIMDDTLFVVHVGDSRCYLLRDEGIEQLTVDHTVAEQLVIEGAMDPEEAQRSQWAHVLWQAVNAKVSAEFKPQVVRSKLEPEDVVLLCSDGLTKHLDDEEIARIVNDADDVEAAGRALVAAANAGGGRDNITVALAHLSRGS